MNICVHPPHGIALSFFILFTRAHARVPTHTHTYTHVDTGELRHADLHKHSNAHITLAVGDRISGQAHDCTGVSEVSGFHWSPMLPLDECRTHNESITLEASSHQSRLFDWFLVSVSRHSGDQGSV